MKKMMKLIDPSAGLMECKVCGFQHYAGIKHGSGYHYGAWQCSECHKRGINANNMHELIDKEQVETIKTNVDLYQALGLVVKAVYEGKLQPKEANKFNFAVGRVQSIMNKIVKDAKSDKGYVGIDNALNSEAGIKLNAMWQTLKVKL